MVMRILLRNHVSYGEEELFQEAILMVIGDACEIRQGFHRPETGGGVQELEP